MYNLNIHRSTCDQHIKVDISSSWDTHKVKTLTLHKQIWPWCHGHPPQTNHSDTRKETREKKCWEGMWGLGKRSLNDRQLLIYLMLGMETFSLKFSPGQKGFPLRASRAFISWKNENQTRQILTDTCTNEYLWIVKCWSRQNNTFENVTTGFGKSCTLYLYLIVFFNFLLASITL